MPGTLFVVATPVGNLEDMTYRAVRILKSASLIACEDTRQTRKLLEHYGIATPLVSYYEHNERRRAEELVALLEEGRSVALVSDAGTPLVADPGFRLVQKAIERGIAVVPVPGPSALLAALAAAGLATDAFRFEGFFPSRQVARRRRIQALEEAPETIVAFEAPHRILETLGDIEELLGPERPVVVAREVTKLHEEFLRGPVRQVREELAGRGSIRGEITLLVGKGQQKPALADPAAIRAEVAEGMARGLSRIQAIKEVARRRGMPKGEVYRLVLD